MGIRIAANLTALGAVGVALIGLATQASASGCSENEAWLRGDFGTARFSVSVVDTPDGRAQGLMYVEDMPRSQGMLFVYDGEAPRNFWMKNTLIPLDILYFDSHGVMVSVAANAVPGDLTPLPSGAPAQFVLEINGGLAARLGLEEGAELRHPRIPDAAWSCDTPAAAE